MVILISGGCKNGKSSLAQKIACDLAENAETVPIYFATMIPCDTEDDLRIEKHRADRKNLGFETLECGKNIAEKSAQITGRVVLFDSLTALVANEMFDSTDSEFTPEKSEKIAQKIQTELSEFCEKAGSVVFVSDAIFSDGKIYGETTEIYRRILAKTENFISKKSDCVCEMFAGQAILQKGDSAWKKLMKTKHEKKENRIPDSSFLIPHLIIGGAYQGKTAWAKREFSLSDDEICVCTVDKLPDFSKRCLSHYENYVAYCLKNGISPKTDFNSDGENATNTTDANASTEGRPKIIICDDIFCGVVPIDQFQRRLREECALALQKIAEKGSVTRIFCGRAVVI